MSLPIAYPASLPGPSVATTQSNERRLISQLDGARVASVHQRDRLATQQLAFTYSFAQASTFRHWWKETLVYGGAWFLASWSIPQGGSATRRFIGAPKWELVENYGWRVTGLCEVRGAGGAPEEPAGATSYYTSWPYPLYVDEALNADISIPLSGRLWIPPLELLNADLSIPLSGTLDTVLHSYSQPAELLSADLSTPLSGTLDTVLNSFDVQTQELNADLSEPLSGTLVTVLVTYSAPPETLNSDLSIPLSGTLT